MTSRYYSNYSYYAPTSYNNVAYRARPSKPSSYYYPKQTAQTRQQYSYRPTSAPKSPKTRSPTLGRKKPAGQWKQKKQREEEKKTQLGEYQQEAIEEQLNLYKKGVFLLEPKMNGHTKKIKSQSEEQHAKYELTKTRKSPPKKMLEVDDLPRAVPPNYEEKMKSTQPNTDVDDTKEPKVSTTKESSSRDKSSRDKSSRKSSSKGTSTKKSSSSSRESKERRRKKTRIQPMVTVSPSRGGRGGIGIPGGRRPYGAFAPPATDYFYTSQGYGPYPPPPPGYFADYPYDPALAAYGGTGSPGDPYYNPYGYIYKVGDGSSYPYNDIMGQQVFEQAQDPYATPKASKRSRKNGDSANVDLTTPLVDKTNGIKKEVLSPGRRVNKIQKQLEYYFSVHNMNHDAFLRKAMDKEGWIRVETVLAFNRMKALDATKELVIEAAFHSEVIEIEPKKQDKIRMTGYWKQYVKYKKKEKAAKEKEERKKRREQEKKKEKELDDAEVNPQTIDQIVAAIAKKTERRQKRREQREKAKKQKESKESKDSTNKATKTDKENDKENDNKQNTKKSKEDKEPPVHELIKRDQEKGQNDEDIGDPEGDDMEMIE